MKRLSLAAVLCLFAAPAYAFHCPADMTKIDAALEAGTPLSEADLAQVKAWRAEGETLHNAGNHAESVETLAKALDMLGLE